MTECPNCTEDEYCSDACADADDPCLHDQIEDLVLQDVQGNVEIWLARCLECQEMVNHHYVGRSE